MVVAPAIGQEELWNKLLDICWVAGHTLPGLRNTVEQPVCHIKPALTPHTCQFDCHLCSSASVAKLQACDIQ